MSTDETATEYRQYRFLPPPGATDMLLIRHGESAPARLDAPALCWTARPTPTSTPAAGRRRSWSPTA